MVTNRGGQVYIWMTINPESAKLDGILISQLNKVLQAMRNFAESYWQMTTEETEKIFITKVDVTVDLLGSFIPRRSSDAYSVIRSELQGTIDDLVAMQRFKFFSWN